MKLKQFKKILIIIKQHALNFLEKENCNFIYFI